MRASLESFSIDACAASSSRTLPANLIIGSRLMLNSASCQFSVKMSTRVIATVIYVVGDAHAVFR